MAKGDWWFKFEFGRWRNDSAVRRCSVETRGFWLECLCVMHETGEFLIEGTYDEISRLVGCSPDVVARCSIELHRTKTADVTLGNGEVIIVSRRLQREANIREQTRLRVEKYRQNQNVTQPKPDRVKSKKKEVKNKKEKKEEFDAVPEKPEQPKTKHGTRMPDTFFVTKEMRNWAAEKVPNIDVIAETENFVDYWRAKPGKDGTKLDWVATWRTWMRRARPNGANRNGNQNGQSKNTDAIKQWEAEHDRLFGTGNIPDGNPDK